MRYTYHAKQSDFKVYLDDILEAVSRIDSYTSGLTPKKFSSDSKTLDAVVRNLEIVGELCGPRDFQAG